MLFFVRTNYITDVWYLPQKTVW